MGRRFVFLGPPGAGKGTQAALVSQKMRIPAISTGGIFREAIAKETAMGRQIGQFVSSGILVPDKLTNAIVAERLKEPDCQKGFILDGYPRSLNQAKALDQVMAKGSLGLDAVLYFQVDESVVVERMGSRRVCGQCGKTYNLTSQQPKTEGRCDACGGELITRDDDQPEAIRKRLEIYEKNTLPLLDYYDKKGLLRRVPASQPVDAVAREVDQAVTGQRV